MGPVLVSLHAGICSYGSFSPHLCQGVNNDTLFETSKQGSVEKGEDKNYHQPRSRIATLRHMKFVGAAIPDLELGPSERLVQVAPQHSHGILLAFLSGPNTFNRRRSINERVPPPKWLQNTAEAQNMPLFGLPRVFRLTSLVNLRLSGHLLPVTFDPFLCKSNLDISCAWTNYRPALYRHAS